MTSYPALAGIAGGSGQKQKRHCYSRNSQRFFHVAPPWLEWNVKGLDSIVNGWLRGHPLKHGINGGHRRGNSEWQILPNKTSLPENCYVKEGPWSIPQESRESKNSNVFLK
jgi:hypothetical protein